jgi:hypothetical protein
MSITHVELELAREPEHPFGNRECMYDLYLPIRDDGRIDRNRANHCREDCRFRCRRPDGCKVHGAISLVDSGRLELAYGDALPNGEIRLPEPDGPLHPGQLLPIVDGNGEAHLFQVLSVRQEWSVPFGADAGRRSVGIDGGTTGGD